MMQTHKINKNKIKDKKKRRKTLEVFFLNNSKAKQNSFS